MGGAGGGLEDAHPLTIKPISATDPITPRAANFLSSSTITLKAYALTSSKAKAALPAQRAFSRYPL